MLIFNHCFSLFLFTMIVLLRHCISTLYFSYLACKYKYKHMLVLCIVMHDRQSTLNFEPRCAWAHSKGCSNLSVCVCMFVCLLPRQMALNCFNSSIVDRSKTSVLLKNTARSVEQIKSFISLKKPLEKSTAFSEDSIIQ